MKLVTQEKAKAFYEEANEAYKKLRSYFEREDEQSEFDAIKECFDKVADLWSDLAEDSKLSIEDWYEGDRLISEGLGKAIRFWNTDIIDQLHFCEYLVDFLGYPELAE